MLLTGTGGIEGGEGVESDVSTPVEDNAWCVGAQLGQEEPDTQAETSHADLQITNFILLNLFLIDGSLERGLNRFSGLSRVLRS